LQSKRKPELLFSKEVLAVEFVAEAMKKDGILSLENWVFLVRLLPSD